MVDGPAALLGRLPGDGDELDDLLGGASGRASRPGGVREYLLNQARQRRRCGLRWLGRLQRGHGQQPAVAPVADGPAVQARGLGTEPWDGEESF